MQDSYVYLIRTMILDQVKIGFSIHPEKRLKKLQTANAQKIYISSLIKGVGINSVMKELELYLHNEFDKKRIRNEWFSGVSDQEIKKAAISFLKVKTKNASDSIEILSTKKTLSNLKRSFKDFDSELSDYLRMLIKSRDLTYSQVCQIVGDYTDEKKILSPQMLNQLLKGKKRYTYQLACILMGALDFTIESVNCELWVDECIDRW